MSGLLAFKLMLVIDMKIFHLESNVVDVVLSALAYLCNFLKNHVGVNSSYMSTECVFTNTY